MAVPMDYAHVIDGRVVEVILPMYREDGEEVLIGDRFSAEMVAQMVDVSNTSPKPAAGDVATLSDGGWTFATYEAPPPTPEQIRVTNAMQRDQLLSTAKLAIDPLQDAVDLGISQPSDETLLTAWKTYRVAVNRIDLTLASPTWPSPPVAPDYALSAPVANS